MYSGAEIEEYRNTMFTCRVIVLHDLSQYLVHTDRRNVTQERDQLPYVFQYSHEGKNSDFILFFCKTVQPDRLTPALRVKCCLNLRDVTQ